MLTIHPTHHCFDDALELLNRRVLENRALAWGQTLILVHGIALGSENGQPYAHAWIEENGVCWDAGLLDGQRVYYSVDRQQFYAARRVQQTTRYTVRQACRENYRTRHYGPWEPAYQALCGSSDQVLGVIEARHRAGG